MNKTSKRVAVGILLCLVLIGIICGVAGAAGYVKITDCTKEFQPGDSLTIAGSVYSDISSKPYEYYVLIIGDNYWYYRYYTQNQKGDSNFLAEITDLGNLPVGEYYVVVVTPSDGNYEVYPEDSNLYYKGTAVANLNNLKGIDGVKTVMGYLQKSDVNDECDAVNFYVVSPSDTTPSQGNNTTSDGSSMPVVAIIGIIVGGVIGVVVLVCFIKFIVREYDAWRDNKSEKSLIKASETKNESSEVSSGSEHDVIPNEFLYCPYCGEKLEKDAKFCIKCGKEIHK